MWTGFEQEMCRPEHAGTFFEYSEMVLQYGYITLFAAAFPIGSAVAMMVT